MAPIIRDSHIITPHVPAVFFPVVVGAVVAPVLGVRARPQQLVLSVVGPEPLTLLFQIVGSDPVSITARQQNRLHLEQFFI